MTKQKYNKERNAKKKHKSGNKMKKIYEQQS